MHFFTHHIGEDGVFMPNEKIDEGVHHLLRELLRWTKGLKAMRDAEAAERAAA